MPNELFHENYDILSLQVNASTTGTMQFNDPVLIKDIMVVVSSATGNVCRIFFNGQDNAVIPASGGSKNCIQIYYANYYFRDLFLKGIKSVSIINGSGTNLLWMNVTYKSPNQW